MKTNNTEMNNLTIDAQSELAALREDLDIWKTKACEAAERETNGLQRLTAAEQRNAELVELLEGKAQHNPTTAPPELAELQADLDAWKETAETFEDFYRKTEKECDELQATIARLTAENERLNDE